MDKPLHIAKYRHRITIRNAPTDASRDSFGGRTGTGENVVTVWAEKQDWSGQESDELRRETASVITKWRIRYRSGVLPKMQIVHGSDVYEIIAPPMDFDGRRRELVIESRKVVVS